MIINVRNNKDLLMEIIEDGIVLPFTLNKATIGGDYAWTTLKNMLPGSMDTPLKRLNYFHSRIRPFGLDEVIMADQKDPNTNGIVVHEMKAEEINKQYEEKRAKDEGSIWNIDKPYSAIFITKETHDKILRDQNRDICIAHPVADCVDIRLYNKDNGIIGTVHSSAEFSTHNLILKSVEYACDHFKVSKDSWIAIVGAYASANFRYYDELPKFAIAPGQLDKDGNQVIRPEWVDYLNITMQDGRKVIEVDYRRKTEDQIAESGLTKVIYSSDCTIDNPFYFSHSRSILNNEREGRNLMGIAFTDSPKGGKLLVKARETKNGIIIG